MNTTLTQDFQAFQAAQAAIANAQRLSEVEQLRRTVAELAACIAYLQA